MAVPDERRFPVRCGRCGSFIAYVDDEQAIYPVERRGKKGVLAPRRPGEASMVPTPRPQPTGNELSTIGARLLEALTPLGPTEALEPWCRCPGPPIPAPTVRRLAARARANGEDGCAVPRR